MDSALKLVISCGGTGGHFYPGLSIARRVRERGGEVMLLLSGVNVAVQAKIAREYGLTVVELPDMPSPHRVKNIFKFFKGAYRGFMLSRKEIANFSPDALLGMGSFASLPPVFAAKKEGVPIFLHDGNARIGRANRMLSRIAKKIFVAFPPVNAKLLGCKFELSGMPLRPELAVEVNKSAAIEKLNKLYNWELRDNVPIVLVMGGSQGARAINVSCAAAIAELRGAGIQIQIIQLCGEKLLNETEQLYERLKTKVFLLPSSHCMAEIYTVADAVFCRAGGSSVAELTSFGKYGVLCPYPYASEMHQDDNARCLKLANCGEIIDNEALSVESVRSILSRLIDNINEYRGKGVAGRREVHFHAADFIIDEISENIG